MSTDLIPVSVPGTDVPLMAVDVEGQPFVALRPACEALGIDVDGQRRKLDQAEWARTELISVRDSAGRTQRMVGIHADALPMWLVTIQANRVAEAARPTLIAFQREAARALRDYFYTGTAVAQPLNQLDVLRAALDQIEAAQRDAEQARAIATKTEARLDAIEGKHDWYSALGYARHIGIENTSTKAMNRLGRQAASIARANGIAPERVPHHLYGQVNLLPMWVWESAAAGRVELAR